MPSSRPRAAIAGLAAAAVLGSGAAVVALTGGSAVASYPSVTRAALEGTAVVGGFVTGPRGFRVDGVLVRAFPVGAAPGSGSAASALTYAKPDGPDRGTRPDAAHGWYALHLPPGDYRLTFESAPGTRPFVPEDYPRTVTVASTDQQLETVALEDGAPNAAPTATTAPSISGPRTVGGVLVADPGTWSIDGTTFRFAWTADGVALPESGPELPVRPDLAGRSVAVTVTAGRPGWVDGSATSAAVQVRRREVALVAELPRDVVTVEDRAVLRFRARPRAGTGAVTGPWEVVVGNRTVASGVLRPSDDGRAEVRLPPLRRGRHDVQVALLGDRAFEAARRTTELTVLRRRR